MSDIFAKYKGDRTRFVETGTQRGDGVQAALDAEFDEIHSFEIDVTAAWKARDRFRNNPSVTIHNCSSLNHNFRKSALVNTKTLFWLDAHFMGPHANPTMELYPLRHEVTEIALSKTPDPVVICDDVRLFERYGISINDIMRLFLLVSPEYKFRLETTHVQDEEFSLDSLVCWQ